MKRAFTLEYWLDDGWYVGKLKEIPNVFSQGETLKELEENIEDAYKLLMEAEVKMNHPVSQTKEVLVEVAWNEVALSESWLKQVVTLNVMATSMIFMPIQQMANKLQFQDIPK